jgi:hypothetical protein
VVLESLVSERGSESLRYYPKGGLQYRKGTARDGRTPRKERGARGGRGGVTVMDNNSLSHLLRHKRKEIIYS